jgi:hypothetical protein
MQRLELKLHPECRCDAVDRIVVTVALERRRLNLHYLVTGRPHLLLIPEVKQQVRADGLWQHTCLEAFVRLPTGAYLEFNFSPSGEWAVYRFEGYREGMEGVEASPAATCEITEHRVVVNAYIDLPKARPLMLALSAVMEETNGCKSYWALAHPGDKPDFHHPDSFVCELP